MSELPLFEGVLRRRVIGVAALWFFICLCWTAPASLCAALLQRLAPLQLDAVQGSFWHGHAGQAFVVLPNQRIALGALEWQLHPLGLLWLHPGLHVATTYGDQFIDTDAVIGPTGHITLHATHAALPIGALQYWLPLPATGLIGANLQSMDISAGMPQAVSGEIVWQRASWQWNSHWLALGDYHCQVHMDTGQPLHCALDGQGALATKGQLDIDFAAKSYAIDMQLLPAATLPQDFQAGLTLLLAAQRDAKGNWQVRRNGKW